jgi:hypothetical protein
LLTMELLAYLFVSSTNPCTRFSVRKSFAPVLLIAQGYGLIEGVR